MVYTHLYKVCPPRHKEITTSAGCGGGGEGGGGVGVVPRTHFPEQQRLVIELTTSVTLELIDLISVTNVHTENSP